MADTPETVIVLQDCIDGVSASLTLRVSEVILSDMRKTMLFSDRRRPHITRARREIVSSVAALLAGLAASSASASIDLLIDPAANGALALRATGPGAELINGYSVYSAGGYLADLGDETLGGSLSAILFDVDNIGDDEVALWTLPGPALPVSDASSGTALNLVWTGGPGVDPLTDLTFVYGPEGLVDTGGDPIFSLSGNITVLAAGLAGDFNGSGSVEQGDLDLVLTGWGSDRVGFQNDASF
ncbi:MAG: hypothetical protein AAF916_09245, partial [Planctomycetota bacterium]